MAFDWKAAAAVLNDAANDLRLIVAGGLRPENVGDAIRELRPWGVDVASGVETSPGRKDPARMAEFLRIAKRTLSCYIDMFLLEDERCRAGALHGRRSLRDLYTAFGVGLPSFGARIFQATIGSRARRGLHVTK